MLAPVVESRFGGANGLGDRELWIGAGWGDDGHSGPQRTVNLASSGFHREVAEFVLGESPAS
jgi:hypothetical protein